MLIFEFLAGATTDVVTVDLSSQVNQHLCIGGCRHHKFPRARRPEQTEATRRSCASERSQAGLLLRHATEVVVNGHLFPRLRSRCT